MNCHAYLSNAKLDTHYNRRVRQPKFKGKINEQEQSGQTLI